MQVAFAWLRPFQESLYTEEGEWRRFCYILLRALGQRSVLHLSTQKTNFQLRHISPYDYEIALGSSMWPHWSSDQKIKVYVLQRTIHYARVLAGKKPFALRGVLLRLALRHMASLAPNKMISGESV